MKNMILGLVFTAILFTPWADRSAKTTNPKRKDGGASTTKKSKLPRIKWTPLQVFISTKYASTTVIFLHANVSTYSNQELSEIYETVCQRNHEEKEGQHNSPYIKIQVNPLQIHCNCQITKQLILNRLPLQFQQAARKMPSSVKGWSDLFIKCPDIGEAILGPLDVESALACRMVCTEWRHLVNNFKPGMVGS